ncbi:MAG: prephenate dehydrogenase/arogenate dehydrogenase family protein [Acidobacteriota bacterium]
MKVGIVGFGSFGQFAARVLAPHAEVLVWSEPAVGEGVSFEEVAASDVIILAVPLDVYEPVLVRLQPLLRAETIVVDICSVKLESRDIMLRVLGEGQNMLVAHPLFGPESAANGTAGHELIVCDAVGERAEACLEFCERELGLKITRISAEQHDRVMAYVQVLTFFVARALGRMDMPDIPFKTPSFNELMDLIHLDSKHSDELFATIQRGNPFAGEVREAFLRSARDLEAQINRG